MSGRLFLRSNQGLEKRERKRGRRSPIFLARFLPFRSPAFHFYYPPPRTGNKKHQNNSPSGRLASAAEEKNKNKQAKALELKKKKLKLQKKKLAMRVAGPVTVVALDAAVASPSGATREFPCFFVLCFFFSIAAFLLCRSEASE